MHIIETCPTQAAWLRWNIWIIYHLQSALPHFKKFSQQSHKIIHVICIYGVGGKNMAKTKKHCLLCLCFSCLHSLLILSCAGFFFHLTALSQVLYILFLVLTRSSLGLWSTRGPNFMSDSLIAYSMGKMQHTEIGFKKRNIARNFLE